jgi:hypothetical protein
MDCWKSIQETGLVTLRTLGKSKEFEILEVKSNEVRIRRKETGTEKSIPKEAFEFACRKLRVLHRVTLKEIDENSKRCGSYVGAIIVKAVPEVSYTRSKPITLVYKPEKS